MPQSHPLFGILLAVLMTIVASTSAATSKYLTEFLAVEVITFIQYFVCMVMILPMLIKSNQHPFKTLSVRSGDRLLMFVRGTGGLVCFYAYYAALKEVPLVDATLLRNTAPLLVPVISLIWLRSEVSARDGIALVVGFVGVCLVFSPSEISFKMGQVYGVIAAIGLAVSMVSTRKLSPLYDPVVILFYYYLISMLGMLPGAISNYQTIAVDLWPYLIYVGVSIHFCMYLYTLALRMTKATVIAPITYLSVVHTGIIGWFYWGHQPAALSIVGMCLVVGAGVLVSYFSARDGRQSAE